MKMPRKTRLKRQMNKMAVPIETRFLTLFLNII